MKIMTDAGDFDIKAPMGGTIHTEPVELEIEELDRFDWVKIPAIPKTEARRFKAYKKEKAMSKQVGVQKKQAPNALAAFSENIEDEDLRAEFLTLIDSESTDNSSKDIIDALARIETLLSNQGVLISQLGDNDESDKEDDGDDNPNEDDDSNEDDHSESHEDDNPESDEGDNPESDATLLAISDEIDALIPLAESGELDDEGLTLLADVSNILQEETSGTDNATDRIGSS